MELRFSFRPTPAEHARVLTLMLRRKRGFWIAVIVVAIVVLTVAIVPALQGRPAGEIFWTVLPYLLIFSLLLAGLPYIQRWQLGRFYRHTPILQQEQTHELEEDGYKMSNPLSNSFVHWDAFAEVLETKEFFLFYPSRSIAYFLPKRAIPTPEHVQQLRSFLRAHVGQVAKLRLLAA